MKEGRVSRVLAGEGMGAARGAGNMERAETRSGGMMNTEAPGDGGSPAPGPASMLGTGRAEGEV